MEYWRVYGHIIRRKRSIAHRIGKKLDFNTLDSLALSIIGEESQNALFSMGPLKAPGSDGLHALFY
ncbi:Retrovirus-related Pol polyprotein LINE-1 [Gossypium australe]|uniref:Retrovirus-related Pol polyprotein LINE-1 n=1 Tax=Gossypium australe TaxID=47621 RepID=A0A5B6VQC8_9ROSI|nr:Retrovirus-related Pol polyprotein LINE-1 [Gossypium australe]